MKEKAMSMGHFKSQVYENQFSAQWIWVTHVRFTCVSGKH